MRTLALTLLAVVALASAPGCYPKTCAPNDASCLPCADPRTTNPACAPPWQPVPVEQGAPAVDGGAIQDHR